MEHYQASNFSHERVAKVIQTNLVEGLTSFEARERLEKFGANKLDDCSNISNNTVKKYIHQNVIEFLKQFANPLIQLLLLCAIISIFIGEYASAIGVSISITIVCIISSVQDRRTDRSLEKLNEHLPNICKVIRECTTHEIEAATLVPGDIIILTEGQRVPADIRLFDVQSLTLIETNLAGETHSQLKSINAKAAPKRRFIKDFTWRHLPHDKSILSQPEDDYNNNYYETFKNIDPNDCNNNNSNPNNSVIANNLALMGTMVESGHSKGIVIGTGKSTRYGKVFSLLKNISHSKSPLQVSIDLLSMHLVIAALAIIAILSIIGIVQQRPFVEVTYYAISLAVTAIPEGLPVVVAIQKASIISKIQELDKIVAMTYDDGVNDITSLKRANLSLGGGADFIKKVADIDIVNNDLSTLVPAVIEGKDIYVKVRRFMTYQISITLTLITLVATAYALRLDCPFTVVQLLFINLLADGPPAQSLGMEQIQTDESDLKPRNVHESLNCCALLCTLIPLTFILILLNGLLYYTITIDGDLNGRDNSLMFTCFVFCSLFAALSLRSKVETTFELNAGGNMELLICCACTVVIQVAVIQIEPINNFFNADPLGALDFVYLFIYSSIVLIFMDTYKLISRICVVSCVKRAIDYFRTRKLQVARANNLD